MEQNQSFIKQRSITKNSDDYDEKYIKITFNLCDELPLNKTIEIVGGVFYENSKYYPQVFLDECWYKLSIIQKCYIMIESMFLKELC